MNLLAWSTLAIALCPILAFAIGRSKAEDARRFALAAASLLLIAAGVSAVAFLSSPANEHLSLGLLNFASDPISLTLGPALCLAALALILMTPNAEADPRHFARIVLMHGCACLAISAADARTLFLAEGAALGLSVLTLRSLRSSKLDDALFSLAAICMAVSWFMIEQADLAQLPFDRLGLALEKNPLPAIIFGLGVAIHLGLPPFSSWLTSALDGPRITHALVAALPLTGMAALARWVGPALFHLKLTLPLLMLALLCAGMAASQLSLGRSYAYALLASICLVTVGMIDPDPIGRTGGSLMWASVLVALTGSGLCAAAVISRIGGPDLSLHHGLYPRAPQLGMAFLLTGIAVGGIPGTVDFAADDLLLHGSVEASAIGLFLVTSTMSILGFNAVRQFFRLFFGTDLNHQPKFDLVPREQVALAGLLTLIFLGGVAPQLIPLLRPLAP